VLVKISETLKSVELDTPVLWKSADRKVSGTWTVTENYSNNDLVCRRLTIEAAMDSEATSRHLGFCKVGRAWLVEID
jgi:hypothetical protein